jgi:hypothetical protein
MLRSVRVGRQIHRDYSIVGRHGKEPEDPRSVRREIVQDVADGLAH